MRRYLVIEVSQSPIPPQPQRPGLPYRYLIHIPRWLIRLAAGVVLVLILAIIAVSRTQVGRDIVKDQVERAFSERFHGSLQIGNLTGNVFYRLVASDVELRDDVGEHVVRIDSIVARPRWRRIAGGNIEFSRLHVHDFEVFLRRDTSNTWNLGRALSPRIQPDSASRSTLKTVAIGDLRLISGEVLTQDVGGPPKFVADGFVFDYANSAYVLDKATITVDWAEDAAQFDIVSLSGRIETEEFELSHLQAQLVIEDSVLYWNELALETTSTSLRSSGAVGLGGPITGPGSRLDVAVLASPLDNDELARVIPRYPLRSTSDVVVRASGPFSRLVVEEVSLRRGSTAATVSGTLIGLPHALDFEVSASGARITRPSFRALLPSARLTSLTDIDTLVVSFLGRGTLQRPFEPDRSGQADFFVDMGGDAGILSGRVSMGRDREGLNTLSADLVADRFRLEKAVPSLGFTTELNGDISLDAGGHTGDDLVATVDFDLIRSRLQGRSLDSLQGIATVTPSLIEAELLTRQGDGRAEVKIDADRESVPIRYTIEGHTTALDLGPLLLNDELSTSLTTRVAASLSGTTIDDVQGQLDLTFDSSYVATQNRRQRIPPHRTGLRLHRPTPHEFDLSASGDLLTGQVVGNAPPSRTIRVVGEWLRDLSASFVPDDRDAIGGEFFEDAATTGTDTITLTARLDSLNADILNSFFPNRSPTHIDLRGKASLSAGPDDFKLQIGASGDSLQTDAVVTDRYATAAAVSAIRRDIIGSLEIDFEYVTDRFSLGGSGIPEAGVNLRYSDGEGTLTAKGQEGARLGPFTLDAEVVLKSGEVLITPKTFDVRARGYDWALAESSPITLTPGSVTTSRIVMQSATRSDRTLAAAVQSVEIRGGIARDEDVRLYARTSHVDLAQISNLLSLNTNIGGLLDGEFELSRQNETPVVDSRFSVVGLSLDQRILGHLLVSSELQAGSSEGMLDLRLQPAGRDVTDPMLLENEAHITGTFRLPTSDPAGNRIDDGVFDLNASIRRADLFFFEYIFPGTVTNVTGLATGDVHIGGTMYRPIFDAELRIAEGLFHVPRFNLEMNLEGDVFVDRHGIHIRRAQVRDKTGGETILAGDVLFNDYDYFSFNLTGRLTDFQIMDVANSRDLPFYGHIWASGTATLTGPLSETSLRATNAVANPRSKLYIPLIESEEGYDEGFIIFADSTGQIPDLAELTRRRNLLASRPKGERGFTDGMNLEINVDAPPGSTVHLVIDPLVGDVINGVGAGRVQILRSEGVFTTFGSFQVNSGDYLFTAGEVFVRRFIIEEGGLITWDGDPKNAVLDIPAAYRTRASRVGLTASTVGSQALIPVVVNLHITGRVAAPEVDLALALDRSNQNIGSSSDEEFLETVLNNPRQSTEYATSVLLTNSFALTTTSASSEALGSGAFNSLSQLVSTQLNRYLSSALPNVDFSFGVQGQTAQELDFTYGVALRLMDERLVIRGEGVYQGTETAENQAIQGEFVVEIRLSENVSVEVFYRREGDVLASEQVLTSTTGAGVSYKTEFPTWRRFLMRLFGWLIPDKRTPPTPTPPVVAAED